MIDPNIEAEGWMSFEDYMRLLGMLAVNCDQEILKTIAGELSSDAGLLVLYLYLLELVAQIRGTGTKYQQTLHARKLS